MRELEPGVVLSYKHHGVLVLGTSREGIRNIRPGGCG